MKSIKHWPVQERPREKLLAHGPDRLSDAELIALILRNGSSSSRCTALDQARLLLENFESLTRLSEADTSELCQLKGIGPAKAAEIQAAFELGRRLMSIPLTSGAQLRSAADVFNHLHARLRPLKKERFMILLLDCKHRVLRDVTISEGSLTASIVHPREVFQPVIRESAAAVILAHNHPSGDPAPSPEDITLTRRLHQAGELMGVRILDHVIIGAHRYASLADLGLLNDP
ncbi:MAG: hypothetical protein C0624_12945 [Desulfuromonas sp.]|nr:MAG: hypothetical protein C0624_12945 [Desulfuromonas sp.]